MRRAIVMVLVAGFVLPWMSGCRSNARDPWRGFENQQRDIREVRGRVADLRADMSPTEVELILGTPARKTTDQWVYLPEFRREMADQMAIFVLFEEGRYESWSVEPVPGSRSRGDSAAD